MIDINTIDINTIDINFDFRKDTICGDPDTDSLKLYEFHKHLWNKKLPNGNNFETLVSGSSNSRLLIKSNLYDNLSSDRMCPHFDGKYNNKFEYLEIDLTPKPIKINIKLI